MPYLFFSKTIREGSGKSRIGQISPMRFIPPGPIELGVHDRIHLMFHLSSVRVVVRRKKGFGKGERKRKESKKISIDNG